MLFSDSILIGHSKENGKDSCNACCPPAGLKFRANVVARLLAAVVAVLCAADVYSRAHGPSVSSDGVGWGQPFQRQTEIVAPLQRLLPSAA